MKYMIKSLSDKITAVIVYLLLAELVVALFLAIDCMVDYHFYPTFSAKQTQEDPVAYVMEADAQTSAEPEIPGVYAMEEAMRVKTDAEFEKIEHCVYQELTESGSSDLRTLYQPQRSNVIYLVYLYNTSGLAMQPAADAAGKEELVLPERTETASVPEEASPAREATGLILWNFQDGPLEAGGDGYQPDAVPPVENQEYARAKPYRIVYGTNVVAEGVIWVCLRSGLPAHDSYRVVSRLIQIANVIRYPILVLLVLAIIFSIFVLGLLMSSIGRKSSKDPEAMPERFIDKIPFDAMILMMTVVIAFIAILIVLTSVADIKTNNLVLWNAIILILTFIISSVLLLFVITLATRIKYGHVYRNTLVFKLIAAIRKKRGHENDGYFKVPFVGKALITIGSIVLIEVLVTLYYLFQYKTHENALLSEFKFAYFAIFQLVVVCVIGALFFMMTINLYHLRVSSKELAKGNLQYMDDSTVLFGDFREISNDFENIKDDMIRAMEEKNRSTEMRNELIANISHDIKTPLTSIINYADIVSSGGCNEEEMKAYLGVISHQSQKLNGLLQSLIEVSKLSAGALEANFESLDIVLYLSQIVDEFSPAFAEKALEPELQFPEESVPVWCDGSMLWRVIENLFNNMCKYAMPHSRVYLGVEKRDGRAVITFRNISAQRITLTAEELMQRFQRNDKSRRGGGNGLGLSIAKSFTELQNGTFDLQVDGDLFKTVLTFAFSEDAQAN